MKKALLTALAVLFTMSVTGLAMADDATAPAPKKSHKKHHGKKPKTSAPAPAAAPATTK